MNGGLLLLMIGITTCILLVIQRTERVKRRGVIFIMLIFTLPALYFVSIRAIWLEALLALVLGWLISFLFWLFVGRYNPIGSSDSIHVLGLDD